MARKNDENRDPLSVAWEAERKRLLARFGENLTRVMAERGYDSNWRLMLASGVNNATIGRWLKGTQEPGLVQMVRVARGLGVPLAELLAGVEQSATRRRAGEAEPVVRLVPQDLDSAPPRRRASRRKPEGD